MIISNITPPQVWLASARSLTNFGSGALAPTPTVATSLAGATTVDLRPSAGTVVLQTIAANTGAGATSSVNIQTWDGTTTVNSALSANGAGAPIAFTGFGTSAVGHRVNNTDATHAATYMSAQFTLTI